MNRKPRAFKAIWLLLALLVAAAACAPPSPAPPSPAPPPSGETIGSGFTPDTALLYPLAEPGPYYVGKRTFSFEDASRDNRRISIALSYPAVLPEGSTGDKLMAGANRAPDMSGAPYPLILTGANSGDYIFQSHLATHGFVMGVMRSPSVSEFGEFLVIDDTLDFLYALDQIASHPPEELVGVIDTDRVGISGFSADGDVALALSGVRVNPEFYLSQCALAPAMEPPWPEWWLEIICNLAEHWEALAVFFGDDVTASADGLWQPITDERIRAVVPMAPSGWWLYGEPGLAAADRPVLILWGTADDLSIYDAEAADFYDHLGTPKSTWFLLSAGPIACPSRTSRENA